jgi:opacity protein-like surface antigen
MNKICKLSAIALLASSTSLMAQSKGFEGASIGLFAGFAGAELEGKGTETRGDTTSASVGKVTPMAGIDLSYAFATGSNSVIGLGVSYVPVKAEIGTGSTTDGNQTGKGDVELKDHYSIYIQPTYVVNKDSALFLKVNYSHADLKAAGSPRSVTLTSGNDVEGYGASVGLKTFLTPNAFVQAEVNYTEYDTISGRKTNAAGNVTTFSGDPKLVQGLITIGYKF